MKVRNTSVCALLNVFSILRFFSRDEEQKEDRRQTACALRREPALRRIFMSRSASVKDRLRLHPVPDGTKLNAAKLDDYARRRFLFSAVSHCCVPQFY